MKIAFYGNFSVPYCSEVHHKKSLEALGHEVIAIQEPQAHGQSVLEQSGDCDLFVWVHTHGWDTPGIDHVLTVLKHKGIPTITYHLDLYMGLKRWEEYKDSPVWQLDYFFTVDKLMAEWLNQNTDVKAHYMPPGVLHEECVKGIPNPQKYPHEIVFTGSRGYHQEYSFRAQLIDRLKATYGDRFGHYGNDGIRVVRGSKLNDLYATAKIVIGDSCFAGRPFYWSDRIPEVLGRGGFLIHPEVEGLSIPGLATYKAQDLDDLKNKVDYYLTETEDRELMRDLAHTFVKANHTYKHRWQEILEIACA